ncbi:MAG: outer membrane beta-barrel protein [Owenweeksia sp.]
MKKITLLLAGVLFSALTIAQPLSNHLYLGGSIGFTSDKTTISQGNTSVELPKTTTYNLSPAIGYTLRDNILLGVRMGISGSKTEDIDNGSGDKFTTRSNTAGAEIFGRYYFPLSERFFFYPDLGIGFYSTKSEFESNGVTLEGDPSNTFRMGVTPGFAFYPTTHWGIELSAGFIGFSTTSSTNDGADPDIETTSGNFDFLLNMASVNIGISYLLML